MRAWKLPWELIARRSAVIFLLTSGINAAVLALSGIGFALGLGSGPKGVVYGLVPAGVGLATLGLFLSLPMVVGRTKLDAHQGRWALVLVRTAEWVQDTLRVLRERNWRLLGAVAYLLCDIAVLWACLRAVGTAPPLLAIVVGYQIGYLANLVPIPGGVGVLEGGLLGALLLYGLPAAPTAAAVVLYHAIALWVPALGGTIGFVRLRGTVANGVAPVATLPDAAAPARHELRNAA
jgi:uncharacterized membrane protein YbhN (UPF0104 family)